MTRPIGDGLAYTDANAVGAVNEWDNRTSGLSFVPIPVAGPAQVLVFQLITPVLEAGSYQLDGNTVVNGTNAGTVYKVEVEVDSVPNPLVAPLGDFGVGPGTFVFSATVPLGWPSAMSHTIDVYCSQPAGPGSLVSTFTYVSIVRIP